MYPSGEFSLQKGWGEDLTRFARERLRQEFLAADAGITGANLVSADCGSLLLVESEANIRLTCIAPPLHIALSGLEKIVPSRREFAPFIELLAASATGQPLTSYTSVIQPPLAVPVVDFRGAGPATREFHLVILDNGRETLARDAQLKEALYCIRCSACLNSCANFQVLGGHGFGGATYSGGIGATWEAATTGQLKLARFSDLCTGCSRCVTQCPVRIDVPGLNVELRSRLNKSSPFSLPARAMQVLLGASPSEHASAQQLFFAHYDRVARLGSFFAPLSNFFLKVPGARWFLEKSFGIDRRRHLAPFPKKTWVDMSADEVTGKPDAPQDPRGSGVGGRVHKLRSARAGKGRPPVSARCRSARAFDEISAGRAGGALARDDRDGTSASGGSFQVPRGRKCGGAAAACR